MTGRISRAVLVVVLVSSGLLLHGESGPAGLSVSYWLWAGLTADDVPTNSELYVFQGHIRTSDSTTQYERLGLHPHPLVCRRLILVYRLEGQLPDPDYVATLFRQAGMRWQRHPVRVDGIQLDFDSPTGRLSEYAAFIQSVESLLPEDCFLSITGLGDWATAGDETALGFISSSVDETVFQLYRGRQPLPDIDYYIRKLADYPRPFRIGLVTGHPAPACVNGLRINPNYRGIIYFVVRAS